MSTPIERVLDLARWAPSADNSQPWRFELLDPTRAVVHCTDLRDHDAYHHDPIVYRLAQGALLESIAIAATSLSMACVIERVAGTGDDDLA